MIRGVIEGFYGPPWSREERLDLIAFCGANGLDTWVHAPKDDPYHRQLWREPYPERELEQLAEVVRSAQAAGVDFAYAIAPGLSVCYSEASELDALVAKCEQLRAIGVETFQLLWDDIEHELNCVADEQRYGSSTKPSAAAQADFTNRFRDVFYGARPLVVCPMGYAGVGRTPYRDVLGSGLDEGTVVYWTGPEVVSPAISREDLDAAADAFGHELLVWDNYPVNDFAPQTLFLGPLQGRDPRLFEGRCAGLIANGMLQAVPSKLPLATVAEFLRDPAAYEPIASFERALATHGAEVLAALRALAGPARVDVRPAGDVDPLVAALAPGVDAATAVALLEPFA